MKKQKPIKPKKNRSPRKHKPSTKKARSVKEYFKIDNSNPWRDKYSWQQLLEADIDNFLGGVKFESSAEAHKAWMDKTQMGEVESDDAISEDALRHTFTSMNTSKAIKDKTGNIPIISDILGFMGTNALGLGHEAESLIKNKWDKENLVSTGEDIINNFVGSIAELLPGDRDKKKDFLVDLSEKKIIPDGVRTSSKDDFEKFDVIEEEQLQRWTPKKEKELKYGGIVKSKDNKMKKPKRAVKKYLSGTKVINPHGSVDEVLEQDRINLAQAKYESEANVWTNMLDLAGSTLMNVGMSGAAKSIKGGDSTGSDFWDGLIKDGSLSKLGNAVQIGMKTFEEGGEVENEIPIEAEDGELYEEPDGTVGEFEGNTHDEVDPNTGETGVQTTKPEGTMIYSDRIMVGDKSVAQKKKARVKAMTSLEKKLENNPTDTLLKNTIEQTKRNHKIEERADLRVQKFSEALSKISGDLTNYSKKKYYAGTSYLTDDPITPEEKVDGDPTIEEWLKTSEGWVDGSMEEEQEEASMPWTLGDTVGTIGTAISTFGPWLKTMKSRGEDVPYTNTIKENYGEKGLKAVADAKDMSVLSRDEALKRVQSGKMASMKRAGRTSRGLRTQEAFKVGADATANTAISEIYSGWSQEMMKLFGMEGEMGDKADLLKMKGAAEAIEKNKEQKDNYDTQAAQDIANIGTGIQKFAGDINKNKQNRDFLSMLKSYSKQDVSYDSKDGWELKSGSSKKKEKGRDKILKTGETKTEEFISYDYAKEIMGSMEGYTFNTETNELTRDEDGYILDDMDVEAHLNKKD